MLYGSKKVKNFPTFYGNHNCLQFFPILSHIDTLRNTTFHFVKINLNVILSPKLGSSKWSLSLMFPHQNPVYPLFFPIRATCPAISNFSS